MSFEQVGDSFSLLFKPSSLEPRASSRAFGLDLVSVVFIVVFVFPAVLMILVIQDSLSLFVNDISIFVFNKGFGSWDVWDGMSTN